ncbi:MAG: hypothetical protein Kow00108_02850 [Calditrichia bacterium]
MFTSVITGKIIASIAFLGLIVLAFAFKKEAVFGDEPYHPVKDLRYWVIFLSFCLLGLYWIF